jgi:hypothetical protein
MEFQWHAWRVPQGRFARRLYLYLCLAASPWRYLPPCHATTPHLVTIIGLTDALTAPTVAFIEQDMDLTARKAVPF